ncbi:MAG: serine/threonine protein kinase [Deltaproteobacteria bacterium]|nr:serine/threonine protein kinase [Deltaproteobacteria bacterium]
MSDGDTVETEVLERFPLLAPWLEAMLRRPTETIRPDAPDLDVPELGVDAEVLATLRDPAAPTQYRLGDRLGVGGMGVVRRARQVALARDVAIKTLRDDRRDPIHAARLLREAWIVGALEHPNIVPIHDLRLDADGFPQLVQKRVDGVSWSSLLADESAHATARRGEDALAWNLRVLIEVCRAVRFAHRRGIVHRDVKPQNVMIGELGEVYLVDWGVAVSLRADDAGLFPLARDAWTMAGTPAYMAPELLGEHLREGDLAGEPPRVSERTDVYLLGATLYEVCVGRPPHRRARLVDMINAVLSSDPEVPDDVPGELAALIRSAMAQRPHDRPPDVDAFQSRLEGFLRHRASAELSAHSARRLPELRAALSIGDRTAIYKLYGAIRFGCLESAKSWPDNEQSQKTLLAAVRAMVEFECEQGDAFAAQRVLADLEGLSDGRARAVPEDLATAVEQALAEDGIRRASIVRLRAEHDLAGAAGARQAFARTLGVVWVLVPLLGIVRTQLLGWPQRPWEIVAIPILAIVLTGLVGVALRRDLGQTGPNRRMVAAVLLAFAAQLALNAGVLAVGLGPPEAQLLVHVPLALVASFFAISVHRRFVIAIAVYALGYAVCLVWKDARFVSIALGNLVMMIGVLGLEPDRPRG